MIGNLAVLKSETSTSMSITKQSNVQAVHIHSSVIMPTNFTYRQANAKKLSIWIDFDAVFARKKYLTRLSLEINICTQSTNVSLPKSASDVNNAIKHSPNLSIYGNTYANFTKMPHHLIVRFAVNNSIEKRICWNMNLFIRVNIQ